MRENNQFDYSLINQEVNYSDLSSNMLLNFKRQLEKKMIKYFSIRWIYKATNNELNILN